MSTLKVPTRERSVTIIHDNPEWIPPLAEGFAVEGVNFVEWRLPGTTLDLMSEPPEGIFWSRLSASSHTRTDPNVKEFGRAVLTWLESAGRTVVNGSAVFELEVSKVRQHRELKRRGFDVPRTTAVFGPELLSEAATAFAPPFMTKHNQGGKGLGVRRFDSQPEFAASVESFAPGGDNEPIDGITLLQEYVQPAQSFVTRVEFIDGTFHYAVKVDISDGSFELCPAEACDIPQPGVGAGSSSFATPPMFELRKDITAATPIVVELTELLRDLDVQIAGVEFIETPDGRQVVYDINTNTNYNPDVERAVQASGDLPAVRRIARFFAAKVEEGTRSKVSIRT